MRLMSTRQKTATQVILGCFVGSIDHGICVTVSE